MTAERADLLDRDPRLLAGNDRASDRVTDLDVALRRALCAVQGLLRGRRIDLDVRVGVPRRVQGSHQAVEALLVDLLSSAVQHTADGGEVTVRVEDQGWHACRVVVTDSGRPVLPAATPRLRGWARDVTLLSRRPRLHDAEALAAAVRGSVSSVAAGEGTRVTAVLQLP